MITGKARALAAIRVLKEHLQALPFSLPLNPPDSKYSFTLDDGFANEEGIYAALSRALEVAFQTYNLGDNTLKITERGKRLDELIAVLIHVAEKMDKGHDFLVEHWLNRLTAAAKASGSIFAAKRYGSCSFHGLGFH